MHRPLPEKHFRWIDDDRSEAPGEADHDGRTGLAGAARSYVFNARELVRFGTAWMERAFG